jgi:hypothetical protein
LTDTSDLDEKVHDILIYGTLKRYFGKRDMSPPKDVLEELSNSEYVFDRVYSPIRRSQITFKNNRPR